MQDPAILRLRSKVRLEAPGGGDGRGRGARLPLLEITLADGTRLTQDAGAVLGTVDNPLTQDQLVTKCRELITPVMGPSTTGRLIQTVLTLENVPLKSLRPLLQRS
jgi:2-methylcitrate dehydratase PrpD